MAARHGRENADTLRVTFTNRLPRPTAVHWHGVRVPNAMDGVPGVTQPPVPPGGTFVYEFVLKDAPAAAHVPAWRGTESIAPRSEYVLAARRGGELGIEWTLNGAAARHAHDIEAASGDGDAHEIAALPRGEWSKLRFVNDSGRLHPIHLHGMFFKVLSRDGRPADEPFFRDTVLVHPRETVDVGVVPLDEGRWMLHCHILEHAEAGMMSLLDVKAM
ncbi:multicopper oxidase domain-containing protein [Sorangium sp. So ce233]|uniref:multicopper oxidase domain-containing protein n=1 Tax=Sorangium sp. So ce233 TaxID=3133290 RepID=UPI003F61D639